MPEIGYCDPNAKPAEIYEIIPAGNYTAIIAESDVRATKAGTGELLELKWVIAEGPHEGRFVFDRINIRNDNPQAQEIGQRQLASLRAALGLGVVRQSEELHNLPCVLHVKVRPPGPDKNGVHREAQNEVKGYSRLNGMQGQAAAIQPSPPTPAPRQASASAPPPQQPPQAAAGASGSSVPPWKRR